MGVSITILDTSRDTAFRNLVPRAPDSSGQKSSLGSCRNSGSMYQFAAVAVLNEVISATAGADLIVSITQTFSASAHPTNLHCGNPHHECVIRNITCNYRAGSHKAI